MLGNPDSGIGNFLLSRWGHLESENILLVESRILGFGIQNTTQEIRNTTKALESGIQVALTRIGIQYLEWGIHGRESRIQGCLGFPHMGLLPLVLRLTAMNSDGSRGEARRAGPPYFYFSFLRPLPPLSEGLDPPLMKVTPKIPILPNSKLNGNHMLILRRFSVVSNSARDANGLFKVLLLSSHLLNS